MKNNFGHSIKTTDDFLNQSFMYVPKTAIRADWKTVKLMLKNALNMSDIHLPFDEWLLSASRYENLHAQGHQSAFQNVGSFGPDASKSNQTNSQENNAKRHSYDLRSEEMQNSQSELAYTMLIWALGKYPIDILDSEDTFGYQKSLNSLPELRINGRVKYENISTLRIKFDSHMYWLFYIKPYLDFDEQRFVPPRLGRPPLYVSPNTLETLHEVDGLLNLMMTIMPSLEFSSLFSFVSQSQLAKLLEAEVVQPDSFNAFCAFLLPENKLSSVSVEEHNKLMEDAAKAWFCTHWIMEVTEAQWKEALLSIYDGYVEQLYVDLLEMCLTSEKLQHQLQHFPQLKPKSVNQLLESAALSISSFVLANHKVLKGESNYALANTKKSSTYKRLFLAIINRALFRRHVKSSKGTSNSVKSTSRKTKIDLYTRVAKATALNTKYLPFIIHFSNLRQRYYHWFASDDDINSAQAVVEEKLNFKQVESGDDETGLVDTLNEIIVEAVQQALFYYVDSTHDIKLLKQYLTAAYIEHKCSTNSAIIDLTKTNIDRDDALVFCSKATENQLTLLNIEDNQQWQEIILNVHAYIQKYSQRYPNAGFELIPEKVDHFVSTQFDDVVSTLKNARAAGGVL